MICHQNKDIRFDHDASVDGSSVYRMRYKYCEFYWELYVFGIRLIFYWELFGLIWLSCEWFLANHTQYRSILNTHTFCTVCLVSTDVMILEKGFCKKTNKLDEQRNEPPLSCLNFCRLGTRVDVVKRHNSMKLRFSVQCNMSNNIYIQWTENHSIASTEIVHFTSWSGQILQHMGKCSKIICIEMSNFMWNLPIKRVFHGCSSYWEWMWSAVCMCALCSVPMTNGLGHY